MSKKDKVKRFLNFKGLDKKIEIDKASMINLPKGGKQFLYLETLSNGKWSLAYTSNLIEDFSKLESIEIERPEK